MTTEIVQFPQDRTCPYHPPEGYRPLARERPISRVALYDGRRVWAITGQAAARVLLIDQRLSNDYTNPAFPIINARAAADRSHITALVGVDDPVHSTQRRMLIPSFTFKRINALRPRIQTIVDGLLDGIVAQGAPAELVAALAVPLPPMVMCHLLGVPREDHELFTERLLRMLVGPGAPEAMQEVMAYLGDLIDHRRSELGQGLLRDVVTGYLVSGDVDRDKLLEMVLVLLIAGHESTSNMLSLGVFTLLEHPEQFAELRAEPGLTITAIEELLRFLSVGSGLLRVAKGDIEVAGTTIREGDGVLFVASVINRDEGVHEQPDVLDWHRPSHDHVSFGFGIHQCLGQNLVRAELEIAFRALFARLPGLRLAAEADAIPFKPGQSVQGMLELPVAW